MINNNNAFICFTLVNLVSTEHEFKERWRIVANILRARCEQSCQVSISQLMALSLLS